MTQNTPYLGQSTDLVLGQEFLTWLWFKSSSGSIFNDTQGRPYQITLEQRVVVQGGEGDHLETASVAGQDSELREARMGLSTGKKVSQALIRIERNQEIWQFTLKAANFSLNSLKTPKIEQEGEADAEGFLLEKIHLLENCLELLDLLYQQFILVRFSPDWPQETAGLRHWISQGSV